jgi:undecaprenyl-diphosphatase|tara:strand:- start:6197 stop:6832 length:636 start_codon:yes stop_codon:yes gene_type:complete
MDTSLHLGSLIAIIHFFSKDLFDYTNSKKIWILIIIGSLPLILVGYFVFNSNLYENVREIQVIAWSTLIFGLLLYFSDKSNVSKKFDDNLNTKNILIIGLFQILALIPGASRSGVVITGSRFLNFSRYDSAKISFILSIPALLGASVLTLKESFLIEQTFNINILLGIFFSYGFSYLTIKYFLIYTKSFSLNIFVVYRILLSLILFYFIYF